jgi:hypothetical protein
VERRNMKFMVALSPSERTALRRLADHERISGAAVVRRLIWREAKACGVLPITVRGTEAQQSGAQNGR